MSRRILIIAPTPFFTDRGTPIRIYEEIQALTRQGHECVVLTYGIGDTPQALKDNPQVHLHRVTNIAPWYTKRSAGASLTKIVFDLQLALLVRSFLQKESFDLIHCHNHEGIGIAWLAKQLLHTFPPVLADLHGSLSQETGNRFRRIERFLESKPDMIVTSSQGNAERIQKTHAHQEKIHVLDDAGIDISAFDLLNPQQCKKQFNIPTDGIVLTYAGGYGKEKGTDMLTDILPPLLNRYPFLHVILVGSVPLSLKQGITKKLHEDAESRLYVRARISYMQLPQLLRATDIAIDTKPGESHQGSGKILNALPAGIPIIAFERPFTRNILTSEQLVPHNANTEAFMETIRLFIENADARARAGKHNQQKATEYSWNRVGEKLDGLYSILLQSSL